MAEKISKKIKIGSKKYKMVSDDLYLENMPDEFEPYMTKLFSRLIGKDDFVVDIGANIGMTGILFGELAAKAVCFEASPSTYALLEENVKNSGLSNVAPVNLGIGSKKMNSTITFSSNNRSGGFVSDKIQPEKGHTTEQIQIVKLDAVYKDYLDKIDFIKLDIEGFEMDAIKGMSAVLKKFQPTIVLELNHWCLNAFRRITIPDFFDFLKEIFPVVLAYDSSGEIRDIKVADEEYEVMYKHIVERRFENMICSFDASIIDKVSE